MNMSFISISGGSWEIVNANFIAKNCFFGIQTQNGMPGTKQFTDTITCSNKNTLNLVYCHSREVMSKFSLKMKKATGLFLDTKFANIRERNSKLAIIEAISQSKLDFSFSNISEIKGINSNFIHISNNTLLNVQSTIMERNNISSLIQSTNNSNITIENSTFIKNKGGTQCFDVYNSTVHIIRSSFPENEIKAMNGQFSCRIFITNSTFLGNHAVMLIGMYYKGSLEIETSLFENNVVNSIESCICVNFLVPVKLQNSTFFNNTGIYTGSICISNSQVEIKNINFSDNSAVQASCIYAPNNAVVNVTGCEFDSNRVGSVVYVTPGSKLRIADTTFSDHTLPEDSLIEIESAYLHLIKCSIMNNTMGKIGGIVQAYTGGRVTVSNCTFDQNTGRYEAVFYLSIKSSLFISDSVSQ